MAGYIRKLKASLVMLLLVGAVDASDSKDPFPSIEAYEADLFSWSSDVSNGCDPIPQDTALGARALQELTQRLGHAPKRVAVKSAERCGDESNIMLVFKRHEPARVDFWLFVFNQKGELVAEAGP